MAQLIPKGVTNNSASIKSWLTIDCRYQLTVIFIKLEAQPKKETKNLLFFLATKKKAINLHHF